MNEWDALEKECDKIERAALNRIQANYDAALRKAIADCAMLLNTVRDIDNGKIKPPEAVAGQGEQAIKKWRQDYIRKLNWREGTAAKIAVDLQKAGVAVPETIRGAMSSVYLKNYKVASSALEEEGKKADVMFNFHQYDQRQLDILTEQNEGVFSKIAYSQFENPALLTQRLQDQLYQATILGDDRKKIIERIRGVTGYEYNRAKRIAQTERTRVQSQARFRAGQDAAAAGVGVYNEWSCAMMETSRETHVNLNGQKRMQGEWFDLSDGDKLRFPGDPAGKACNIINCYCALIPHVLLPGERLNDNGEVEKEKSAEQYSIVDAKDITGTWQRNSEYEYAVEDIIHQQGFDGFPHVVGRSDFDSLVMENELYMVRRYSEYEKEKLDGYVSDLRSGNFYVKCENDRHALGRGMYTAARYVNHPDETLWPEVSQYGTQTYWKLEQLTLLPKAKIGNYKEIYTDYQNSLLPKNDVDAIFSKHKVDDATKAKWMEFFTTHDADRKMNLLWNDIYPNATYDVGAVYEEMESLKKSNDRYENDVGAYAAAVGWDAYNEQINKKTDYMVVLNRTALVILEDANDEQ